MKMRIEKGERMVTTEEISAEEVLESVAGTGVGATVLFLGTMRDFGELGKVTEMTYEAYVPLAERSLADIRDQILKRRKVDGVRIVHRVGKLYPKDVAVAIAVSSAHRNEAFEACRFAIESIKVAVPIWKKEKLESGEEVWTGGEEISQAAAGADMNSGLRCVIVTVSTSKHAKKKRGEEVGDESGAGAEGIMSKLGYVVSERHLVSDSAEMIRSKLDRFLDSRNDVIVFVGGTGVSPDDITIETVRPYIEREYEGFGEMLRGVSYKKIGAPAFLTRATAGTAKGKLVVCLPGSPDAVATALEMFAEEFPVIVRNVRRGGGQ